ncbi:hypothetical protein PL263_05095 [Methylomonas sp. EFPC3]|uniref:hypothetical protein n=1 Tax=Methylomonas sp. EFPC3 TaxID=3021710 RepID=UPI0024178CE5|nr:hypothetical protein [Methylomonas sp. EFPC3]WFP51406.1 hypothetical protein PL263_05095 [Methylomonas sp. EFPC3]
MIKKTLSAAILTFSMDSQSANPPTFKISADQLIETYNSLASKVDGMKKLPAKSKMEKAAENEQFVTLQHYVLPNAIVTINIDKKNGHPYAIGVISKSDNKSEELDLFNVRSLVGTTIFGPSSEAGELEKLCVDIYATGHPGALKKTVKNFTVSCGMNDGLWIALITKATIEQSK